MECSPFNEDYSKKTYQFKTSCKDDCGGITQLKTANMKKALLLVRTFTCSRCADK